MAERNDWRVDGNWADDDELFWDQETGAPTKMHFANAVQVWALMRSSVSVSVAQAAEAFCVPPARIVEAVEEHHWMLLTGPDDDYGRLMIEHDGE